jgi:hypothetical protein
MAEHKEADTAQPEGPQGTINTPPDEKPQLHPAVKRMDEISKACKERADEIEKYELLVEADRVASVAEKHEKEHKYYIEQCPICLDDVRVVDFGSTARFLCCGGTTCSDCFSHQFKLGETCPLCRAEFPELGPQLKKMTMKCAERGVGWAQYDVGMWYVSLLCFLFSFSILIMHSIIGNTILQSYLGGRDDFTVDKKKAMAWLEKAAKQRYPFALRILGKCYYGGDGVSQSYSKAFKYFQDGANRGDPVCQYMLGVHYYDGKHDVEKNESKGFEYLTIDYHQWQQHIDFDSSNEDHRGHACQIMGFAYFEGKVCNQSYVLAKYYLEEALKKGQADESVYLALSTQYIDEADNDRVQI